VLLLALLGAVAGSLGVSSDASSAFEEKVAPALLDALAGGDGVRIVVSLEQGPPAQASGGDAGRRDVADKQARTLALVSPSAFQVSHRYASVHAFAGTATPDAIAALAASPDVAHIALDVPMYGALGESGPLINADDVHGTLGITGDGVTVAVLDSGVDSDHPELANDLLYQRCFLAFSQCPTSATIVGCSGTTGAASSFFAEDGSSHGSHVSGIVTKTGTSGAPGIAPDAGIKAFKVLNDCGSGQGLFSDMIFALDEIITLRATTHADVDIVNMSIVDSQQHAAGTCETVYGTAMPQAITTLRSLGVITFVSSGNAGFKTGLSYPACILDAVSVGATYDGNLGIIAFSACIDAFALVDQVACWSQSDASLDLLAPGSTILSTVPPSSLGTKSGTSMASPTAAGVAALLLESEPGLTPGAIESRLEETGVPIVDAFNGITKCRVDAYEAVINDGGPKCPTEDSDGIAPASDNCDGHTNPLQEDNEAQVGWAWLLDGAAPEALGGGDACDPNDDNAGCADVVEPLLSPARDPLNPWDFADVWTPALPPSGTPTGSRNRSISLTDVAATLTWVGAVNGGAPNPSGRDYDSDVNTNGVEDGTEYDRSPAGAVSGAPSGAISLQDVGVVLAQVGDAC
jgi:subtilisin family serine protease